MIDWQAVAISLIGMLASWAAWELRSLRKTIHDLRDKTHPLFADIAYIKGYLEAKKSQQGTVHPPL